MYTKLAVPLDGSALAEQALPYAIHIAGQLNIPLLLLRAARMPPGSDSLEQEKSVIQTAQDYLDRVRQVITGHALRFSLDPALVKTQVELYEPVDAIAGLAPFEGADLIVMTTHSRTGLDRILAGSVADRVLQRCPVPVLLIRPLNIFETATLSGLLQAKAAVFNPPHGERLLITLDGSDEAEVVLAPAFELARRLRATVYLLRIYQTLPAYYRDEPNPEYYGSDLWKINRQRSRAAFDYLTQIEALAVREGLTCSKAIRSGDTVEAIRQYAYEADITLLTMATHARGAFIQTLLGSVAAEVLRASHLPVLMVNNTVRNEAPRGTGSPRFSAPGLL